MDPLISVVIPTYCRPAMLGEALASIEQQRYPHLEIVIGDDSPDDAVAAVVAGHRSRFPLRFIRNRPARGAAANVEMLFHAARGARILVLHDDDYLLPHAIALLDAPWQRHPELVLSFGKHVLIADDGRPLPGLTQLANRRDRRTAAHAGLQPSEAWSAMVCQIPPNAFLLRTDAARALGVDVRWGSVADFDFNLRLATRYRGFYYVDEFVSAYRKTRESNTTRGLDYHHHYALLARFAAPAAPAALAPLRAQRLRLAAVPAVTRLLQLGDLAGAREVFEGPHYAWRDRLRPKGLVHALALHAPGGAGATLFAQLRALRAVLGGVAAERAYSERYL